MEVPQIETTIEYPKNPLLCPICLDYFIEPCILNCYHTFCGKCLHNHIHDKQLICPFCRQPTILKDDQTLPPLDTLMCQLIDIANNENPPCTNCDKRDRANMYYCNTCGQALCANCRDNTHRAKMFITHEIVHMTKCIKEPKRCPQHGEQYIMYSPIENQMLCVNCFRNLSNDYRLKCIDIDTAYKDATKNLEHGQTIIMDLQISIRDGIISLNKLMNELHINMDTEKLKIIKFSQNLQDIIHKTHQTMLMEVQRQYECKERIYRNQLLVLGTVMPILQLHIILCKTFTTATNKYQFLELSPKLLKRLLAVSQLNQPIHSLQSPIIKTNYRMEFGQNLELFINSTTNYEPTTSTITDIKLTTIDNSINDQTFTEYYHKFEKKLYELNEQYLLIKKKFKTIDINNLTIYNLNLILNECQIFDKLLLIEKNFIQEKSKIFHTIWDEKLNNIHIEKKLFNLQYNDYIILSQQFKQFYYTIQQLEPLLTTTTKLDGTNMEKLEKILKHINMMDYQKFIQPDGVGDNGLLDKKTTMEETKMANKEKTKKFGQNLQSINIDQLESHIKDKLHLMMCRRQSQSKSDPEFDQNSKIDQTTTTRGSGTKQKIFYKKIGKSCDKINTKSTIGKESDYQHIANATTTTTKLNKISQKSDIKKKSDIKTKTKIYPYSDGEDNVFYSLNDSLDSLSTSSRRSSYDGHPDKTLVVVINRRNHQQMASASASSAALAKKQRSWETFPPKRRHHICHNKLTTTTTNPMPLRKTDSFEGHEEAVKSLVAAVQETRRKSKSNTN